MRAVLMTICLAALVAACDSEPPIRISRDSGSESSNTDGPLRVVDTLQCPQTHEVLTRRGGPSADGRSCEYTGPRGSQVTLRLVTLDGEGLAALDALEAEVQAILPSADGPPRGVSTSWVWGHCRVSTTRSGPPALEDSDPESREMRIGGSESQAATRAARQIVMSMARMYRSSSEPIVRVASRDASEIAVIGPDAGRFIIYFR